MALAKQTGLPVQKLLVPSTYLKLRTIFTHSAKAIKAGRFLKWTIPSVPIFHTLFTSSSKHCLVRTTKAIKKYSRRAKLSNLPGVEAILQLSTQTHTLTKYGCTRLQKLLSNGSLCQTIRPSRYRGYTRSIKVKSTADSPHNLASNFSYTH